MSFNGSRRSRYWKPLLLCAFLLFLGDVAHAQGSAFTYQGKLSDAGAPASGLYDFEFRLFDAGGAQLGPAVAREDVQVTNGSFTVELDFGAPPFTGGTARALEIGVRPGASAGAYTTLAPRQPLNSSPYSIQTVNAEMLGGVAADQYVRTDDPRLTDGGPPAPGSTHYIQNTSTQQAGASFNVGGNGIIAGNVGVGTASPQSKLTVNANGYGLTHTNGSVTVGSFLTSGSGWLGTRSNHPLQLFTNDGAAQLTLVPSGEVGVGVTPEAGWRLDAGGNGRFRTANGNINFGSPNAETGLTITNANRADLRFDGTTLKLLAGTGTGVPAGTSGIAVTTGGSVGIGTEAPAARLHVEGPTGLFGTGLRVTENSVFGVAISARGHVRQELGGYGFVKALVYVGSDGNIVRCYDGEVGTSLGCGFSVTRNVGSWWIDFGFNVSGRFWSVTPGNGVSNVAATASSPSPNVIAVKLFRTDITNSTGEDVFRDFMLVVY
jgi:hypothetical protein